MSESKLGPKHLIVGVVALFVLFFGGSWVYVTFIESEESKVRRAILEVRQAADDRNPREISNMLTEDFRVSYGPRGADKTEVHNAMVKLLLADYKFGFKVRFTPIDYPVEVSEDERSATARFKAYAKGKPSKDGPWMELSNREASGQVTFVTSLKKTEDGWKLRKITFEREK